MEVAYEAQIWCCCGSNLTPALGTSICSKKQEKRKKKGGSRNETWSLDVEGGDGITFTLDFTSFFHNGDEARTVSLGRYKD